jgi:hypothetical protein
MVMGFPAVPEPWTVRAVVIVPQRWTSVPGVILPDPEEDQFPDVLNHETDRAFAHEDPSALPVTDWAMNTLDNVFDGVVSIGGIGREQEAVEPPFAPAHDQR